LGGEWLTSFLIIGIFLASHEIDVLIIDQNWCTLAGGTGAKVKYTCPVQRSKGSEHFLRMWLPELRNVPEPYIYEPWKMNQEQQEEFNVKMGVDYPHPIIKLTKAPPPEKKIKEKKKKRLNRIIRRKKLRR
jgi:deoxyribodipyrimidine photo-lyase